MPTTFSKISLALQSNSGNIIYEKSLGFGEKLYIGNSQVIAMSEQILIQKHDNQTVLMGPGLVFLYSSNSLSVQVNQYNQNFVFGILITMFFMLITIQQLIYWFFIMFLINWCIFKELINHLTGGGKLSGNSADLAANLASTMNPSIFFSWGIFFRA